uniref:disease resistance protein At4g27190-like isoform X2 n=1 Tax=Fragaria vesca subsp. vesca TaxID=101020 RepID=UPI0005CB2B40|nr:PREDICTED: disease resistance protein At4g27190-like isoform X2 [Fragaria vesca subsp. vesca]
MADIVIAVVGKLAEYTVEPVLRQFGYLSNYKSNVEDITMKVTTLTATRDGVQLRVDGAKRNLEDILPEVQNWLERVQQTIQEKETCFEEGRVAKATTCCSSNGWCPNLKGRHSLSRKAAKMAVKLDKLITDGNFTTISCPAPPPKLDYPAIPYYEDSIEAPVKPHEEASSSSGTSNPAKAHVPMDLSDRLEYRLPYTKDLLTALQDDKINIIGISGTFRELDTVTTKEFIKRMKHRNLFEEVVMALVSQDPDLKRIQDEIAEMLDLKLEKGSLVERAERLRTVLLASDSKRFLVILTDVWKILDLEAIGIYHVDIKKSCKIMLISQLPDVFGEMGTRSNFRLLLHSTPIARPVEFESRNSVIRDVMDALTDDESNPIVICGMGGIGKTTLVMEIGAKAGEVQLFDEIAIAEFTQEPDLIKIQGQIAKALRLELTGEDDRAAKLRERLSRGTNNVLLILDNVWTQLNLWEIGIPISRDQKCCKLLVTSRNQDIFKEMKTRKHFPIGGLPRHDAWSLFKKVAGGSIESDLELCPIAEQVLAECDGLPVAISTVGGALQGKSISRWRNALRELRNACPENVPGVIKHVYGKIVFSYECLPSEQAKSCFLLCCLFPESEDFDIEMLVRIAIGLGLLKGIDSISEGRDCVETLVDTLKDHSLLLDGDEKDSVRMHDVVRDVAVYIASQEFNQNKNDKSEKRIVLRHGPEVNYWRRYNAVDESGSEESAYCRSLTTCTSSTELLLMGVKDWLKLKLRLLDTIFDGMEDLKVLLISCSILPSLPLLKNIQTLVLVDCHLNFDVIGELRTLMILDVSGSDIKHLPDTFKNLCNLRLLNLTGCDELKVISPGVISSLSRLEELYMWDSFQDWVVEKLGSAESTNWVSELEDGDAEPEQVDMWKRLNRLAVEKPASTETTTDRVSQLEDDKSSEPEEVNDLGCLFRGFVYKVHAVEGNYDQVTRWANSMDWRVGLLSELLSLSRLTTLEVVLPPLEILRTSKLFHNLDRFKISIGWRGDAFLFDLDSIHLSVQDLDLAGTGISLLLKKTQKLELKMKKLTDPLNVLNVNCYASLKSLTLEDCDSLEYLIDTTLEKHTPRSVFPVLDYLTITGAKRLKEIFHGELPPGSLQKLKGLWLNHLPELTTIWTIESQSRWMGDLLAVLESIKIKDCQSVEAIFGLEGSEHHVKEINFLSLTELELVRLPCFTRISKSTCKGLNRQLEVSSVYPDSLTDEQSLFSDPKS